MIAYSIKTYRILPEKIKNDPILVVDRERPEILERPFELMRFKARIKRIRAKHPLALLCELFEIGGQAPVLAGEF